MSITRRSALCLLSAGLAASKTRGPSQELEIARGPFAPTRASLETYQVPDWFRDAKFGIWAHWGPQSAAEAGDWYARNMYMQGSPQYEHHVRTYGHPSKFGFKDIIPTWNAADFDPNYLLGLYSKAGAKYFVSMGVHHDNFDLWNSKHTRWNSVNMGPRKDIVALLRKATLDKGLKFGVTEHLWITYKWFSTSHGSDNTGPLAGVPYDGVDPANADLYTRDDHVYTNLPWNQDGIPESWQGEWFRRVKDLIDQAQPDLLYTDGPLPFESYGLHIVAHLYNSSAARHGGAVQAVYNSKRREDCATGTCVLDVERGIVSQVWPQPWQTDTSVGDWHYRRDDTYKSPKAVIDLLVDVVSRNGNLLLNFPLPNNGALNDIELNILSEITAWMAINSEAIHDTRPWRVFGEGPAVASPPPSDASFNEKNRHDLTREDIRFTTKPGILYAIVMGEPERQITVRSLAMGPGGSSRPVQNVEMLGAGKLKWTQSESGLTVQVPEGVKTKFAATLKIAI